jgi:hypothetical protein
VAGQAAFGARTLTDTDAATLRRIAGLQESEIREMLQDAKEFCTGAFSPEAPAPGARSELYERLGLWGIGEAVRSVRAEVTIDEVKKELVKATGLDTLRDLVISHFGNRALLIQAAGALQTIRDAAFYPGERLRGPAQEAAHKIVRDVDQIMASEPRFREFSVLESYYRGELDLAPRDLEQLLDVTGEHGNSCAHRLGASPLAPATQVLSPIQDLIAKARGREAYWRGRVADRPSLDLQTAFKILAESNADIQTRLLQAAEYIRAAFELLN